ncbi:MAG: phage tail sheath family protein [Flavobacteriales bacterium]|nr:phage tail sheath family protein [Flavobacteriales bacterium]
MNLANIKTPGVYINEVNGFGNSVVPVATAVPAFIGYTPQASYEGKSYANVPQQITSFAQFQAIYCYPTAVAPAVTPKQYNPEYYLVKEKSEPEKGDYMQIEGEFYSIVPDPNTIYYLYNSIKLFYENGGADAYIVSIGTYGEPSKNPMTAGDQIVNPNVSLDALMKGIGLLKNEEEPTMYICPEATLLSVADNGTLMEEMLLQNSEMGTAISIFDIIGGRNPDPILYTNDIETFRDNTGAVGLKYGVAYYPFVGTTIMQPQDIDFTNLFGGDLKQLEPLINPADAPNKSVAAILGNIDNLTVAQANSALTNASKTYGLMIKHILADLNMMPPSAGMAGVITATDNAVGPWKSPANTSMVGVSSLPIRLNSSQQADLNVDAISGKSINAIRFFNGLGILIWGARTLDGNSLDWRYISVRRTMTFLEQSCKLAAHAYVFEANDVNTWKGVIAMISSFLGGIWNDGGLQGASAAQAFDVQCGLGSTMTPEDILNGFMRVTVKVAIVHPAEFIVLTFEQEMAKS